jgi:hypothetical protein
VIRKSPWFGQIVESRLANEFWAVGVIENNVSQSHEALFTVHLVLSDVLQDIEAHATVFCDIHRPQMSDARAFAIVYTTGKARLDIRDQVPQFRRRPPFRQSADRVVASRLRVRLD